MRDLTQDEILEYIEYSKLRTRTAKPNFEQTGMIADAFIQNGLSRTLKNIFSEHPDLSDINLLISVVIFGFQLGRECESRLIDQALKKQI